MTGHLIHIGYPKTGTSYLKQWFEAHPELAYADQAIAGFSTLEDLVAEVSDPKPSVAWRVTSYEGLSAPPQVTLGYVAKDRPPYREQQAAICATLASVFPNASIMVVTRGFRSVLLSSYSQYLREGGAAAFHDLFHERAGAEEVWNYDYLIGLYRETFGPDRVLALPYELLRDEPATFLGHLSDRLEIGSIPFGADRVNPTLSPHDMRWYPRISRAVLTLPVGRRLRSRLFRIYVARVLPRLGPTTTVLQKLFPATPVTADLLPHQLLDRLAGCADCFRDDPLYRRYASDYLL